MAATNKKFLCMAKSYVQLATTCVDAARRVLPPILFRPSSAPTARVRERRLRGGRKTIGVTRSRLAGAVNTTRCAGKRLVQTRNLFVELCPAEVDRAKPSKPGNRLELLMFMLGPAAPRLSSNGIRKSPGQRTSPVAVTIVRS